VCRRVKREGGDGDVVNKESSHKGGENGATRVLLQYGGMGVIKGNGEKGGKRRRFQNYARRET